MNKRKVLILGLVIGNIIIGVIIAWQVFYRGPQQSNQVTVGHVGQLAPNETVEVEHPNRPHWIPEMLGHKEKIRSWSKFSYTTNGDGFRGREFSTPKAEGIFRILVAGECVSFGFGVADREPYPVLLEEQLDAAAGKHLAEVFNLSMFGVRPIDVYNHLHGHAENLAPDLIIFAPGAETIFVPEHVMLPARLELGQQQYRFLLESYRNSLRQSIQLAGKLGVPIIFVTPTINSFFLPDGVRWVETMKELAAQEKIPLFDTTALVAGVEHTRGLVLETDHGTQRLVRYHESAPEVLFETPFTMGTEGRHVAAAIYTWLDDHPDVRTVMSIDENHLTAEGHQIVAAALIEFLNEHNLLPK